MAIITGNFISNGQPQNISLIGGVSWIQVTNQTNSTTPLANAGVSFTWSPAIGNNNALITLWNAGATDLTTGTAVGGVLPGPNPVPGFSFSDENISAQTVGPARVLTSASNGGAGGVPRLVVGTTVGLSNNNVIRIYGVNTAGIQANTGIAQFIGQDFIINNIIGGVGGTVDLPGGPLGIVAAAGPATSYRVITGTPRYFPFQAFISAITQAANPTVTTTEPHLLQIGQKVRFNVVSPVYGMTQIDGLAGTVLTVPSSLTFTVDIDTTAFNAFTYPTSAIAAVNTYTDARVEPFGENTGVALDNNVNILGDSIFNNSTTSIVLGAGLNSPAGTNGNVIEYIVYTDSLVA